MKEEAGERRETGICGNGWTFSRESFMEFRREIFFLGMHVYMQMGSQPAIILAFSKLDSNLWLLSLSLSQLEPVEGNNLADTRLSCKALLNFSPLFPSFLVEFHAHHFTCCCFHISVFPSAFITPQFSLFFFQLFPCSISHFWWHLRFPDHLFWPLYRAVSSGCFSFSFVSFLWL